MCVGITIIKWDSTCHSQTHGTEPPVHFCCSHYISPCFLSTPPFILSLSLAFSFSLSLSCFLSLSLSFSLSLYLCPLFLSVVARHMSSDALYQIFSSWSILLFHTISFHSSYKIHQLFTDYLLRLPSSELLEKHFFRSRANRRLVLRLATWPQGTFRARLGPGDPGLQTSTPPRQEIFRRQWERSAWTCAGFASRVALQKHQVLGGRNSSGMKSVDIFSRYDLFNRCKWRACLACRCHGATDWVAASEA